MSWLLARPWAVGLVVGLLVAGALFAGFGLWLRGHDADVREARDIEWQAELTRQRSAEQARQAEIVAANYARGLADGIVRQSEREEDRAQAPVIVREIVEKSAAAASCRHDGVSAAGLGRLRVTD